MWICLCAFLNCAGWVLSMAHGLNRIGYAVVLLSGVVLGWRWIAAWRPRFRPGVVWRKLHRRFRQPLPLVFFSVGLLVLVGGAIHSPNNYDALAYRVPRVLHWLAEDHWHWIPTTFERVNTRGCSFEWVAAPLIAFTNSIRSLFLLNFVSFWLLPGLIFSILTRLGVTARAAYCWMWVLPSGYCFLLQAGSLGNDLFCVPFILAALHYGLRARQSGRVQDLWLSFLAVALSTGVKANILPLGLPWLVVAMPCWRLVLAAPLRTAVVCVICLGSSFLPIAAMNWKHSGDWTGAVAEELPFQGGSAWARVLGNAGIVTVNNLLPPIAPYAGWWNTHVAPALVPKFLESPLAAAFPRTSIFSIAELQTEEGAGLGFGVWALLAVSAAGAMRLGRDIIKAPGKPKPGLRRLQILFVVTVVVATAVLLRTSFVKGTGRLLTPYYLLLILPLLLHPAHQLVVRQRWWRVSALAVWALAVLPVLLSPSRPLLPLRTTVHSLRAAGWSSPLLARVEKVYSVYGERADAFSPLRSWLPEEERVIGLVTFDDPETSLWLPFGARRIVHISRQDTPESLRAKGVRFLLIAPARAEWLLRSPFEAWRVRIQGEVIHSQPLTLRAGSEPLTWCVMRLQ